MAKVLITGCAKSGTRYIANLLQACDVDVIHENIGRKDKKPNGWENMG